MRRLWSIFLCLVLLLSLLPAVPVGATGSLEQQIGLFIKENHLSEENFSLSYYNNYTGEACAYNADLLLPAGRLWMLPLHMYFCEQESMGAFDPSFERPLEEFTIHGLTLKECRYESLILGREEVAQSMREHLGSQSGFKRLVNEAFGHLPDEQLTETFLSGDHFTATFWMNCFRELTGKPVVYDDLTRNYTVLQTADALAGYSRSFAVFQVRGEEDGWLTALAKVWTPEPYILVCSIRDKDGDRLLSELNDLVCSYVEQQTSTAQQQTTLSTEIRDLSVATDKKAHSANMLRWIGVAVGGALVLAALIALPIWLIRRKREHNDYYG